jgi:hypothetical protein
MPGVQLSVYYAGQFPGQVIGILQAGVHALPAHGRVDMRGIAN